MKNITILCKDFEVTAAIKAYVTEKIESLGKYINTLDEVTSNVRLGKISNSHQHGKIYYAEASIHTADKNYGLRVESDDIYAAVDLLKDGLANNITTYKDKQRTLHKKDAEKFKQEIHAIE